MAALLAAYYVRVAPSLDPASASATAPSHMLITLIAAFTCVTLVTSSFRERSTRLEFAALRRVNADIAVQERLLHRMVPPHVMEALMHPPSRQCAPVAPRGEPARDTASLHSSSGGSNSCSTSSLHSTCSTAIDAIAIGPRVVRTRRRRMRASTASRLSILSRRASLDLPGPFVTAQPWRRSSIDVAASALGLSALVAGSEAERRLSVIAGDATTPAAVLADELIDATSASPAATPCLSETVAFSSEATADGEHCARKYRDECGSQQTTHPAAGGEEASFTSLSALHPQRGDVPTPSSCTTILQLLPDATVMFISVANFDAISTRMPPLDLLSAMNALYSLVDSFVESQNGVYKVLAIGGSYLCVAAASGLGPDNPCHARACVEAAAAILVSILRAGPALFFAGESPSIKIGICSGPIAAGVLGTRTLNWHVFVSIASRVGGLRRRAAHSRSYHAG